jgi:hypothetical protein
MKRNRHTTDSSGFDYMANTGREEKDRDACAIVIVLVLMAFLTVCQYAGLY